MKKRTLSVPVLAVVAVLALILGSFGTATAAGLTTKQVKKIAAKVVKKKAKNLTVANAKSLAGRPAAHYDNGSYAFRLRASGGSNDWNFPGLPAGTYHVSWTVLITGATTGEFCYLEAEAGTDPPYYGFSYLVDGGGYASNSTDTIVPVAPGAVPHLICDTGGSLYDDDEYPYWVVFTKVGSVVQKNAADRAGAGAGAKSGPASR